MSLRPSWARTIIVGPVPASTSYRRTLSDVRSHMDFADRPFVDPQASSSVGGPLGVAPGVLVGVVNEERRSPEPPQPRSAAAALVARAPTASFVCRTEANPTEHSPMKTNILTATEGALLGMLARGERSGYELTRR